MSIVTTKVQSLAHDARGDIWDVVRLNDPVIRSVLKISMTPSSPPRGNHWHKKDTHWVYVDKGRMRYSEADPKSPERVESVVMNPGDIVVSKPGIIHAMEAVGKEEVIFWAISTEARDQKHYEEDTKRIKIV